MKFCIDFLAFYLKESLKCAFNCVKPREPNQVGRGRFVFRCWNFGFCKSNRCKIGVNALTQSPPSSARAGTTRGRGGDWMPISPVPEDSVKFRQRQRPGPCRGASGGTCGSAPGMVAHRPWSVMRGLCWNHWFRPLSPNTPRAMRNYSGIMGIQKRYQEGNHALKR